MKIQSVYKVPAGKLLKIYADKDEKNNTIEEITISGDFFAYPEESIQELERELTNISFEKQEIYQSISTFIEKNNVQFIGVDAESLTEAIMRCV